MRKTYWIAIYFLLVLAACSSGSDTSTGSGQGLGPGASGPRPYQTVTPSSTPTPIPPLAESVLPTPTPFTYTVAAGDNLNNIALHFNISLEELMAANPGVSPTALQVGATLNIPVGGVVPGEPTPTPVPLMVRQTRCWPGADSGLWCFALVQNEYSDTLENISAQFILLDSVGQELASQVAFASLNILPPGAIVPVTTYFTPPVAADAALRVQVLTAIRILPGDQRYLPVAIQNTLVSVDSSGRTAHVTGQAVLNTQAGTANTIWVLGVAYDQYGNVVGLRRWESTSPLAAGSSLTFDFTVSSVGSGIERVEFLVEARP